MWVSSGSLFESGIRVDGVSTKLVHKLYYPGFLLKNNKSREKRIQQKCANATSVFNSLTKFTWLTPIINEVKLRVYLSAVRPIMMHRSKTWAAL
ncbi:hypothetical protein RB195_011807 [Necator americanus]|uniref:Uncharacterized protein n=1 Tax=Necator americanus TaxID=51031 RepID=A0ABR1D441_NECAM